MVAQGDDGLTEPISLYAAAAGGWPATADSAAASSVSASGGLAASSLAHGSSNSTRHLPSSFWTRARRARNERPARLLKPVTGLVVRPRVISSRATDTGSCLPALPFQITNPQPGSSRPQQE